MPPGDPAPSPPDDPPPTPPDDPALSAPDDPGTTPPDDPRPMPGCIATRLHGCLSPDEFREQAELIAEVYKEEAPFSNQEGLLQIGAEHAWARLRLLHGDDGDPGAGQTIGLIDTGIDTGHSLFAGKTVTEVFMLGPYRTRTTDEDGTVASHGTGTASVAAGRASAEYAESMDAPHGVAWGADIVMFVADTHSSRGPIPVDPPTPLSLDQQWANWIAHSLDRSRGGRDIDFVNASLALGHMVERYSEQEIRDVYPLMVSAFAQRGASEKTVFVAPTGNTHGTSCDVADFADDPTLCVNGKLVARSPQLLAGLPARIPELRGHFLGVASVRPDGEIASASNRCGIAAQWCLAAPGDEVRAAYFGPSDEGDPAERSVRPTGGTSLAAPIVTGALVVMKHYFRGQLSNTALVERMLKTAARVGIYADSAVYGQGLLDLDAATSPVGGTGFARGDRVGGPGDPVAGTRFALGNALGRGPVQSFAGRQVVAFDELGAPFWYALEGFVSAAPGASAIARLDAFMAPQPGRAGPADRTLLGGFAPSAEGAGRNGLLLGVLEAPAPGFGGGHISLAGNAPALNAQATGGLGVTAFSSEGMRGQAPVSGALLSWRPAHLPFALAGGWTAERETMLGSRAAGAFGRLSANSAFLGLEGKLPAGDWHLEAGAELGIAAAARHGGMLTRLAPLVSSAFALRAKRAIGEDNSLRIDASQPLRVESGRARLRLPVGRSEDGRVLRRSFDARLAPSGRQIDLAASWRKRMISGGELRLGASWTRHPSHDAAAPAELTLLAGWRKSF